LTPVYTHNSFTKLITYSEVTRHDLRQFAVPETELCTHRQRMLN
jgi:hypothetical protein